jgi:ketosteroid isomerase-like protein
MLFAQLTGDIMQSIQELLRTIYSAYREKRLADAIAHLADDFRFTLHLPKDTVPGAGAPANKAEATAMFQGFMDTYDFLAYDPGDITVSAEGDKATASPTIRYRHKATGKIIETRISHFWNFRNGQALTLDEYHDTARIKAFLATLGGM